VYLWKVKAFYWRYDEPCVCLYLIDVVELWLKPKKACSLLCLHLWKKAKAFYWGHELWDQTALWNLSTIKTERNEVHVPTANDREHLSALITFKFSAKITHTHGILTPGDFHPDRSGGHVVPRWKSPDVMVDREFRWKSPDIMVSVSSGENHPALLLVWVRVKISRRCG